MCQGIIPPPSPIGRPDVHARIRTDALNGYFLHASDLPTMFKMHTGILCAPSLRLPRKE